MQELTLILTVNSSNQVLKLLALMIVAIYLVTLYMKLFVS